jgi:hypothetical protein
MQAGGHKARQHHGTRPCQAGKTGTNERGDTYVVSGRCE